MTKSIKLILLVYLLFGLSVESISQVIQTAKDVNANFRSFRINPKTDGIKGTPFLYDEPPLATITLQDGKAYENLPFNILLEEDQVYIQTGGDGSDPFLVKNWTSITATGDEDRVFRQEVIQGRPKVVEILFENENGKYVAVHEKKLVQPSGTKDSYSGPKYETYRHNIKYFFLEGMNSVEIKVGTAGLKDLAGDRYGEVRNFMKAEKLKFDNPYDIRKIIDFLEG